MVGTSVGPGLVVVCAVLAAAVVWQIARTARLLGRSSIVGPSAVGEDALEVRCGAKVKGGPGEGASRATWPCATLVIAENRSVVRSPIAEWDFPRGSSTVELIGPFGPFRPTITLRRGSLTARVNYGRGDAERVAHALQQHGWFGQADASDRPPAG
jgi:hypothetical protein